jgi:lipoprotein-anchoring transpeptidase ErfK/SrfK
MYWYYKYPLLGILLLLLFGVGYVVWRSQSPDQPDVPANEDIVTTVPAPPEAVPAPPTPPRPPANPVVPAPTPVSAPADPVTNVPVPPPVEPPAPTARLLETARNQLAAGNLETGRELARRAMASEGVEEFDKAWYLGAEIISEANTIFMNSGAPCSDKIGYVIQPGDNLTVIANRLRTTVGALQRMNPEMLAGTATDRIYPGRTLFALRADWSIRVSKAQHVLLLYNGPDLFKLYHVALGRENRTPVGTFEIVNKVFHPDWTHPSGEIVPYGDKRNILGTHWLAIRPTGTTDPTLRGFGIHGTWEPESIGTDASLGCVRMRNEEAGELYDFIPFPRGENITSVTIE